MSAGELMDRMSRALRSLTTHCCSACSGLSLLVRYYDLSLNIVRHSPVILLLTKNTADPCRDDQ